MSIILCTFGINIQIYFIISSRHFDKPMKHLFVQVRNEPFVLRLIQRLKTRCELCGKWFTRDQICQHKNECRGRAPKCRVSGYLQYICKED